MAHHIFLRSKNHSFLNVHEMKKFFSVSVISSGCRKGSANRVQRNVEIISGCRCFSETTRRRMTHAHRTILMIKNGKARFVYAHRLLQGRFCKHSSRAEIRILYAQYALSIKKGGHGAPHCFLVMTASFPHLVQSAVKSFRMYIPPPAPRQTVHLPGQTRPPAERR